MPTGVTRIAAPLVSPKRPASSTEMPAATAEIARWVDGPSRSSDPRRTISRSQSASAFARMRGSIRPPPSIKSRAMRSACSVSSVM